MKIKFILHLDDFIPYIEKLSAAKVIAVDTETTGLDPHIHQIRLIQLAAECLPVLVIDCFSFLPDGLTALKHILSNSAVKIFQNAKFDLQFFMPLEIYPPSIFDTMLAAQLLRSSGGPVRANLELLAKYYLNEDLNKKEQKSDWSKDFTSIHLDDS
ncbi:hypothetical protein [Cellulosilyticum sp. I15G10I2]|uniref:hypothetical protein n=1 Tax=Cellulosilyticum sp. I15G10I2 TaxID=1892843 RepID=UPI00085C3C87|nr:hypothetical protein [Cellulosilyticum sp. I15G10I2]